MQQNIIVMEDSRTLRAFGRKALQGHWKTAFLGVLLYTLLAQVPALIWSNTLDYEALYAARYFEEIPAEFVTYMSGINVYSLLVSGPLTFGLTSFIMGIFRRRQVRPLEVFYGFEKFGKTFALSFMIGLFTFLWSMLFVIPGIVAAYRYSMAYYILADHPEIGVMEAIRRSKVMTQGNKAKLFCLEFSFIGWSFLLGLISSLFTTILPELGLAVELILTILLTCYTQASITAYYEIAAGHLQRRTAAPATAYGAAQAAPAAEAPAEPAPAAEAPAEPAPAEEAPAEENKAE
ncbi:MAG: DUF975 family protein [Clostridiales bacterium]|nr:DUF975 family protein [Clostridiales bacterium]